MAKKIADKNWILTAYDELSADGDVSAIAPNNQGQAARTTDNSRGKGIGKSQNSQKKTTRKVKPEQPVGDLFAGLLDEEPETKVEARNDGNTDIQRTFANTVKNDMLASLDNGTKPYQGILDLRKRAKELALCMARIRSSLFWRLI